MGSRIAAAIVLMAGIAVLAWVGLRSGDDQAGPSLGVADNSATDAAVAETVDIVPTFRDNASPEATVSEAPADEPTATAIPEPAAEAPENFGPRRSLVDLDGWLNTDITSLDELDGRVVMVEMWTFGCSNCKARIPYNQAYYEEFAERGFEIVGVHAPEFNYEADIANIEKALVDLGVTWPVALDTNKRNFHSWQPGSTAYWPRTYVIDQNGDIRYDHIGEGRYEELRQTIAYLLDNPPQPPPPST